MAMVICSAVVLITLVADVSNAQQKCLDLNLQSCGSMAPGHVCIYSVSNLCSQCKQANVVSEDSRGGVLSRSVRVPPHGRVTVAFPTTPSTTGIREEMTCKASRGVSAGAFGRVSSSANGYLLKVAQADEQAPPGFKPIGGGPTGDSNQPTGPSNPRKVTRVPFLFNDCDHYVPGRPYDPRREVDPFDHYCCAGDGTKIGPLLNPDPGTDKAAPRGALCYALHPVLHVYVGCAVCYKTNFDK